MNWIDVTKQKPEGYKLVLVLSGKNRIDIAERAFYEEEWWCFPDCVTMDVNITHWMPLPAPSSND